MSVLYCDKGEEKEEKKAISKHTMHSALPASSEIA